MTRSPVSVDAISRCQGKALNVVIGSGTERAVLIPALYSASQAATVRLVICARYAAADFIVIVPASVSFPISVLARFAACAV
jgi:hypothetical protein